MVMRFDKYLEIHKRSFPGEKGKFRHQLKLTFFFFCQIEGKEKNHFKHI